MKLRDAIFRLTHKRAAANAVFREAVVLSRVRYSSRPWNAQLVLQYDDRDYAAPTCASYTKTIDIWDIRAISILFHEKTFRILLLIFFSFYMW